MPEAVRLVVWDLDDTFWKGTITEGGITHYVQEHHDIIVELAHRGIMSSICSKNDMAIVEKILREKDIWPYFIFPSISWAPKGGRLAAMLEEVQLRPATVMFIDDNPSNRAEAQAILPDLQIEDETFIANMLMDSRFVGKDDRQLTRLGQYKLLEKKKVDQAAVSGSNEEFLRSCNIQVEIEYDVETNLDRAIELINRTNQLNYTKRRLPENLNEARRALQAELNEWHVQAGLVRVKDDYGDYGFVGFFMTHGLRRSPEEGAANNTLRHFCFSCRTLGMLVEQWVYDYLRRPELSVVGDVLTDLNVQKRIDWITLAEASDRSDKVGTSTGIPQMTIVGGCEVNALGVYLQAHVKALKVVGNYTASGLFIRVNGSRMVLSTCDNGDAEFLDECDTLGIPRHLGSDNYFRDAPEDSVFVINCARDSEGFRFYRHRSRGWVFHFHPEGHDALTDLNGIPAEDLEPIIMGMRNLTRVQREHCLTVARHVRANYDTLTFDGAAQRADGLREIIRRIPIGSKLVLCINNERMRYPDGSIRVARWVARYNEIVADTAKEFPFVAVVSFAAATESDDEIRFGGNHSDRRVYLRMSRAILDAAGRTPARRPESSSTASETGQLMPA